MKKIFKLFTLFIITLFSMFISNEIVFAGDNSPSTFKVKTYTMSPKPLGLTQNISVKKTTDGKYIYCYDVNKRIPNTDILYTRGEKVSNSVISNIIASGYSDKTDKEFYATQSALWIYLLDSGLMKDTSKDYIQDIKDAINGSYTNDSIAKDIKNIITNAKNSGTFKGNLDITNTSAKFTLKEGIYTSDVIKVNTNLGEYKVTLSNQPTGTKINYVTGGFTITVPEANAKVGTTTIKITISDSYTKYNTYKYNPSNSVYQIMLASYPETVSLSDSISLSLTKTVVEKTPTVIEISKQDKSTKKELPGATLVIKDSNGKVVKTWVSTNKPVQFSDLAVGTYTLEETAAPDGYFMNAGKVTFEVKKDNEVKKITIYNELMSATVIEISKQDITTKKELPGATLVIKDSNGKTIEKWVSTNTPKQFSSLAVGTYTLEETAAPDGYTLNTEKITFKVKNDGKISKVVMYNEPKDVTTITISKQDITTKSELPGATLVIKDSNGKVIEMWVSTDKPKLFSNLPVGKYTLEETIAPNGYELSTEKITFEIKKDGKIDKVIMYNTPKNINAVSISKQDITTKKELPGATLIIRDNNGVELYRWVSTEEPYMITDLKNGKYTLEEIIAPNGYVLSNEKITFVVEDDNLLTKVIMYNTPVKTEVIPVPITSSFSFISYIIGGIGILSGAFLLYKNTKKES